MLVALTLLSAALLAYQVVLVHLLSITHWTHFAALVISLALLGFGASGSFLALLRRRLAGREGGAFWLAVLLAALSFDPLYRLSTRIPFDAFELLAVPRQFLYLSLTYLVLSVPFFLGATAIALAFLLQPGRVARVYAANLVGSGLGAVLGLALLAALPAGRLPTAVGLFAGFAVVPLAVERLRFRTGWRPARVSRAGAAASVPAGVLPSAPAAVLASAPVGVLASAPTAVFALAPAAILALALFAPPPRVPVSIYKDESVALALPGARVAAREEGPLGRLDLVASPALRYLPGASLALATPVPPRPVLYLNGQPLGFRALASDSTLIGLTTTAAAFALPPQKRSVLLLGLGGGGEILYARARGAETITVVDPDRRIDRLLAPAALDRDVRRVARSPRSFLRATDERFDLVLVTEVGSLGAVSAGMAAAGEGYLFTVEGMTDLWRALDEDGLLAVTRWVLEPPRDVLRLLATARAVLEGEGARAADHIALVRGWGTATLLVSRHPLAPAQVEALRGWSEERWFDLSWAPGVGPEEANRFNLLEPDFFRIGAEALLGPDPEAFVRRYPFRIAPVTDDAPFFFHFLPPADLVRLWRAEGRLGLPYFEWGLVAQTLTLAQAVPVAAVLILLPLLALPGGAGAAAEGRRRSGAPQAPTPAPAAAMPRGRLVLFLYFALLGVAYMLLEISSIQRLVLFLAQPIYATTVVLASFLLFAGAGSALAPRLVSRFGASLPFAGIALLAPLTYLLQVVLLDGAAGAPLPARMLLAGGLLAPLAFCMGMPFPLGLQRVADRSPAWLPWCWGVNGYLSVIGAAAAPLVALGLGFRGVIALAIGLYLAARWALGRL
jgi:hypothetical protein